VPCTAIISRWQRGPRDEAASAITASPSFSL
jgi:hypothetical protein